MGPQLMEEMRKQAERFGAELVTDDVTSVDLSGDIKTVTDGSGNTHPPMLWSSRWVRGTGSLV